MSVGDETLRLRDEVIGTRVQLEESLHRLSQAETARAEAVRSLDDERAAHMDTLAKMQQVERERDAILHIRGDVARLQREIHEIHRSRTWRIGRIVLLPVRILRRMKRILRKA